MNPDYLAAEQTIIEELQDNATRPNRVQKLFNDDVAKYGLLEAIIDHGSTIAVAEYTAAQCNAVLRRLLGGQSLADALADAIAALTESAIHNHNAPTSSSMWHNAARIAQQEARRQTIQTLKAMKHTLDTAAEKATA